MAMSELAIQKACVKHFRMFYPNWMIHHSPNGGSRKSVIEGANLKASGVIAGFPDLVILGPNKQVYFIELKTDTGKQRDSQKVMQERLEGMGFEYAVVRGLTEFAELVQFWCAPETKT